jgi:hypothetical protein
MTEYLSKKWSSTLALGVGLVLMTSSLALSGCGGNTGLADGGGTKDLSGGPVGNPDLLNPPCKADTDCSGAKPYCDVPAGLCRSCVKDAQCASGTLCNAASHTCVPGCSMGQACGDAGVCEVDAGQCVQCNSDGDCKDPKNSRCDTNQHVCAPCNPTNDNCGYGLYCGLKAGTYDCLPGCKADPDCNPMVVTPPDMATTDDASVTDDGGLADGGGAPGEDGGQGGVDAGGGQPGQPVQYCAVAKHTCVQCNTDDQCPLGRVCTANQCIPGCTLQHGCNNGLTCCGMPGMMQCTDSTSDFQNCGGCGVQCQGGWNCCNSACSNPVQDVSNCGGCGMTCEAANGVPTCTQRVCAIAKCNQGWAHCVGNNMNGCETHIDVNVNNCGACNNACQLPHSQPKCIGGTCQVDTCAPGWGNCDNMAVNGCEQDIAGSPTNCGGCGLSCSSNNVQAFCSNGQCTGNCKQPFADCDSNKLTNGCEVDTSQDTQNCGGCGNDCNIACDVANTNVTGVSCGNSACTVTQCANGFYDIDGDCKNGCECQAAPVGGATCGGAQDLGIISPGGPATAINGNMVGGVTDAWFKVNFQYDLASANYHPLVTFDTNGNPGSIFKFEVLKSCMAGDFAAACPSPDTGNSSDGRTTFEEKFVAPAMGPTFDPTSDHFTPVPYVGNGGVVFVHVFRTAAPVAKTCAANAFTLLFSNIP